MSKLYDIREALAASIAEAGIFRLEEIIIIRQADLFNEIATALSEAKNGVCLHIGVAEGKPLGSEDLDWDITVPLTIVCPPEQPPQDATPEEDLWEALVQHVHGLRLKATDHVSYQFRAGAFGDVDINDEQSGVSYLGRQTFFTYRLSL
jgi:hypothetical protein